jgi:hypothetical protein
MHLNARTSSQSLIHPELHTFPCWCPLFVMWFDYPKYCIIDIYTLPFCAWSSVQHFMIFMFLPTKLIPAAPTARWCSPFTSNPCCLLLVTLRTCYEAVAIRVENPSCKFLLLQTFIGLPSSIYSPNSIMQASSKSNDSWHSQYHSVPHTN